MFIRPKPISGRNPLPGQSDQITLNVEVNPDKFVGICASFVLYGLSLGADRLKATSYLGALQVIFKNSMADGSRVLTKAPRIFWIIDNALRPKTVKYKRYTYHYTFDSTFNANTDKNPIGCIFGASGEFVDGLVAIDTGSYTLPTLGAAVELAAELFGYFSKRNPLISQVDDFLYDPSIYAWTGGTTQYGAWDYLNSDWHLCALEVPIRSWLGYSGIATRKILNGPNAPSGNRIGKFAEYCMGGALHYVGLRLYMPGTLSRRFVKTKISFSPIDMNTWLLAQPELLINQTNRLVASARVEGATPGFEAPDVWKNNGVSKNLFLLSRYKNIMNSFTPFACCWASASIQFCASAVGTNIIDPISIQGASDVYANIASTRELKPSFDAYENIMVVPYPMVMSDTVAQIWAAYPEFLADSVAPRGYGGTDLDLLNSNISGQIVSLVDGQFLRDDFSLVTRSDNANNQLLPTSSVFPSGDPLATTLVGQALQLVTANPRTSSERDMLLRFFRFARRGEEKGLKALEEYEKLRDRRHMEREIRIKQGKMSAERTNISTTTAIQLGTGSIVPLNDDLKLTTLMMQPVKISPDADFPDMARIIYDMPNMLKSTGESNQSFVITRSSNGDNYIKDPNNFQGSELSQVLLDISKSSGLTSTNSSAIPLLTDLAINVGTRIVKKIASKVRERRAVKAQRKQKQKK